MIKNLTSGIYVSEGAKYAHSFIDKTFGMILSKNSSGLIFKTRFGIHTFFMKSAIDVLVLDSNNIVTQIQTDLKPFRFFFWNPNFDILIEVPENSVKNSQTKIGDRLKIS